LNQFTEVKPNGYTLAAYNLPHIITQPLVGTTTYKTSTFEPIVNWGSDPTVFAVKADSDIKSLEDLIKKSKQNPGSVTIGHSGKYAKKAPKVNSTIRISYMLRKEIY
jgi:tripartite-type tricarboxylate transporter receptor subunit TctC